MKGVSLPGQLNRIQLVLKMKNLLAGKLKQVYRRDRKNFCRNAQPSGFPLNGVLVDCQSMVSVIKV